MRLAPEEITPTLPPLGTIFDETPVTRPVERQFDRDTRQFTKLPVPELSNEQKQILDDARSLMAKIRSEFDRYDHRPRSERKTDARQQTRFLQDLRDAGIFSEHPLLQDEADESQAEFIIPKKAEPDSEGWFCQQELNIVAGASGSGKSTFVLDALEVARLGEPFLDHPAPAGFDYRIILLDRGPNAFERTAKRMKLSPEARSRRYYPSSGSVRKEGLVPTLNTYLARLYSEEGTVPAAVFVEGLDFTVPEGRINDLDSVAEYAERLVEVARRWGIALIGSMGAPKRKSKDFYLLARDNVMGSSAWPRFAETVVYIQEEDPNQTSSPRLVKVLPRNGASEHFTMGFKDGRLKAVRQPELLAGVADTRADVSRLGRLSENDRFKRFVREVLALAPGIAINPKTSFGWLGSDNTVRDWLREIAVPEVGLVERQQRGRYVQWVRSEGGIDPFAQPS